MKESFLVVWMLALAELKSNKLYYLVAVLGVAIAVTAVVWMHGILDTKEEQNTAYAAELLGSYDYYLAAENPYQSRGGPVNTAKAKAKAKAKGGRVRARKGTRRSQSEGQLDWASGIDGVDMAFANEVMLQHYLPWTGPSLRAVMFAVDPEHFNPPPQLDEEHWLSSQEGQSAGVVIDRQQADRMAVEIGDEIELVGPAGRELIAVVGIVEISRQFGQKGNVYVVKETARSLMGEESELTPNLLAVRGVDRAELGHLHTESYAELNESSLQALLDKQAAAGSRGRDLRPLVVALACMVSGIIIYVSLSVGISKRVGQYFTLMILGARRRFIRVLVISECLIVGLLGGVLGLIVGALLLQLTVWADPLVYPDGLRIDYPAVCWAFVCSLGGSAIAACVAIFRLLKSDLAELKLPAMARQPLGRLTKRKGGIALACTSLALVVPLLPNCTFSIRAILYTTIALPGFVIGALCLAPALLRLFAVILIPAFARVLRFPAELLLGEFQGCFKRVLSLTMMVAICIGAYTAVSTWGASMLKPFLPNTQCPDLVLRFSPTGVSAETMDELAKIDNFAKFEPMQMRQFTLGSDLAGTIENNAMVKSKASNVLVLSVDGARAFLGERPLFDLGLSTGEAETISQKLLAGDACVIPASFAAQSGLELGDQLQLGAPADGGKAKNAMDREFTVVGIYTTPWHLLTKKGGMRDVHGAGNRCMAMVFVGPESFKPLAFDSSYNVAWGQYTDDFSEVAYADRVMILNREIDAKLINYPSFNYRLPRGGKKYHIERPWFRVGDLGQVIDETNSHASRMIAKMSRIPLWFLQVVLLALFSVLMSSVWNRRWSFGVLRSLGMPVSQQVRLVLAEALIIGLSGGLIGLLAGLYIGYTSAKMAHYAYIFSGITVELVVPWAKLWLGIVLAVVVSLLAAIIPAIGMARRSTLQLLTAGKQHH